jgi:hypothetical protein
MQYVDKKITGVIKEKKESLNKEFESAADWFGVTSGNHNGQRDAFRHAYSSALTTYRYGGVIAEYGGDRVERDGNNPPSETAMDLYNNRIGREIGARASSEAEIAPMVAKAVRDNVLQVDVNEPIINRRVIDD